jgi:cytochrome c-type biogenesis protein CcsB
MNATQWGTISNYSIYSALIFFTIGFFSHAVEVAFSMKNVDDSTQTSFDFSRTQKSGRIGTAMVFLGTIAIFAGIVARGISAGRVPWGNMYEFSITGAFAFSAAYLYALKRYAIRWLGLLVSLSVLLTLGTAVTLLYRPSAPLVPALKSTWLVVHVSAAILSGGVFLLANCVAGLYLILDRYERLSLPRPVWAQKLPSLEELDQISYRLVAFVFPLWTFAIIAGAIWAESAWGHYWSWDPKETWALITWIAYAAYLHARVTIGWKGRRAAWLCIFAGSTFLFNYVYINVWGTGRHTYSGL